MELALKLTRSKRNPILAPTKRGWENKFVFNPGVIQLGNKIHLIYRAHGEDGIARLGYARLKNVDEVEERLPYPVFSPGEWFEPDGVEDARLVAIEDRIFMLYASKDKNMARVCTPFLLVVEAEAGILGYPYTSPFGQRLPLPMVFLGDFG